MIEKSFRELFFNRDIKSCSRIIEDQSTTSDLIKIINDLIYISASLDVVSDISIHPISITNSIKNFISDNRSKPSKLLLNYALNYLSHFNIRDDEDFLNDVSRSGLGEIIFAGDLEDLCQKGNWDEAKILTAKLFLASDQSRAVMDTLVELALQDPKKNIIFSFHLLRAYQFQELKEDNWTFILCLFNYLSGQQLPKPHKNKNIDIVKFKDQMLFYLDPSFLASLLRIWEGDYVRIRGYRRELSHWINLSMKINKQILFTESDNLSIKNFNFIELAEKIVLGNGENIESDLVILESLRYLNKEYDEKKNLYIVSLISKLLKN